MSVPIVRQTTSDPTKEGKVPQQSARNGIPVSVSPGGRKESATTTSMLRKKPCKDVDETSPPPSSYSINHRMVATNKRFQTLIHRSADTGGRALPSSVSRTPARILVGQSMHAHRAQEGRSENLSWALWILVVFIAMGFAVAAFVYRYVGSRKRRAEEALLLPRRCRRTEKKDGGVLQCDEKKLEHVDGKTALEILKYATSDGHASSLRHIPLPLSLYGRRNGRASNHHSTSSIFEPPAILVATPQRAGDGDSFATVSPVATALYSPHPSTSLRHRDPHSPKPNSNTASSSNVELESQTRLQAPGLKNPSTWFNDIRKPQISLLKRLSPHTAFIGVTVNAVADRIEKFTRDDGAAGSLILPVTKAERLEAEAEGVSEWHRKIKV